MILIKIVLYKDRFDVYFTNSGDIMIRIVLNRRDVSGQDLRVLPGGGYTQVGNYPHSSVLYGIFSERRSVLAAQVLLREKSGA